MGRRPTQPTAVLLNHGQEAIRQPGEQITGHGLHLRLEAPKERSISREEILEKPEREAKSVAVLTGAIRKEGCSFMWSWRLAMISYLDPTAYSVSRL